jgi:Winged helix DNA-binding domain
VGGDGGRALSSLIERFGAQLLSGPPAPDPVAVADRLLAVQGQDGRGVRLAIRARTSGLSAADVDRALTEDRTLLITWLNRGTLHLVRSEDYFWLHALTTPPLFTPVTRRLEQTGVDAPAAERGVAVIEKSLVSDGVLTRAQLRDRLSSAGIPTEGQALVHLLLLSSLHGIAVRGPMVGRQHAYVLVRDWLGAQPKVERERALGELARRYLVGHAPAGERDLAKWSGLPLRDVRAGLQGIARELRERDDGLLELRRWRTTTAHHDPEPPSPRLLGSFDPVLLGWSSRAPITGEHDPAIVAGGMFRPFALVDGHAAASWRIERGRVVLEPLAALRKRDERALRADGEDVLRYLGL